MRQHGLLRVIDARSDRGEVILVDAARQAVHVLVQRLLVPEQAGTAGEHQVGELEQRVFAGLELARRLAGGHGLLDAVVNDGLGVEALQQRQCRRRVQPDHRVAEIVRADEIFQQPGEHRHLRVREAAFGDARVGPAHVHVRCGHAHFEPGTARVVHRFLEKNTRKSRASRADEVLGTAQRKIPAELRKDDHRLHAGPPESALMRCRELRSAIRPRCR